MKPVECDKSVLWTDTFLLFHINKGVPLQVDKNACIFAKLQLFQMDELILSLLYYVDPANPIREEEPCATLILPKRYEGTMQNNYTYLEC